MIDWDIIRRNLVHSISNNYSASSSLYLVKALVGIQLTFENFKRFTCSDIHRKHVPIVVSMYCYISHAKLYVASINFSQHWWVRFLVQYMNETLYLIQEGPGYSDPCTPACKWAFSCRWLLYISTPTSFSNLPVETEYNLLMVQPLVQRSVVLGSYLWQN